MMPRMNGWDATRTIRAMNRPDAEIIPIIAMTANAFAEDVQKCLDAGDCSLEGGRKMKKCKLVQNIRNFKSCYFIFCTMICLVVFPVSTSAQENSDHVIRVGSFEETYNVVNEKGERSGYGYEYLQDIAGYAGWTYKYITSDWKNCFTQLENGEIDILGDISYTDERAENMLFSDMPMGEEKYYIYTDLSLIHI